MSGKEFRLDQIVFCFEHFKKCKQTEIRYIRGRKFLDKGDSLYLFREHTIQANRRNSSRRGVCGLNLFSHLRSIIRWFDARVIFQNPSIEVRQLGSSSIRRYPSTGIVLHLFRRHAAISTPSYCVIANSNVYLFLVKVAPGSRCVSLYPDRCVGILAGRSSSFPGSSRSADCSGV